MKIYKIHFALLIFFAFILMSCQNEIIPPATNKEIIQDITRNWSCKMTEDGSSIGQFDIVISANSENDKVNISNFHNSGNTVIGTISNLNITIPEQKIGEQYFKGSGEISNDYSRITWNYTIENANGTVLVSGVSTSGGEV